MDARERVVDPEQVGRAVAEHPNVRDLHGDSESALAAARIDREELTIGVAREHLVRTDPYEGLQGARRHHSDRSAIQETQPLAGADADADDRDAQIG